MNYLRTAERRGNSPGTYLETRSQSNTPALLTHYEVQTVFMIWTPAPPPLWRSEAPES